MPMSYSRHHESGNRTHVTFRVTCEAKFGESIHVVGDIPSLGCWEKEQGVPLVTTPSSYPEWYTTKPIAVQDGYEIKYKFMVFSGGKFDRWENYEGNRTVKVSGATFTVADIADSSIGSQTILKDSTSKQGRPTPLDQFHLSTENEIGELSPAKDMTSKSVLRTFDSKEWPHDKMHKRNSSSDSQDEEDAFELHKGDGVIVVSYYLPVICTRKTEIQGDIERTKWSVRWDTNNLLSRKRKSAADSVRVMYVGCPKIDEPIKPEEQDSLTEILAKFHCIPVFVDSKLHEQHWVRYCEGTIKHVFHNIVDVFGPLPTRWWNRHAQEDAWQAYTVINQQFTDKVVEIFHDNDLIWVHGNELLLLPSFLARRLRPRNVLIGLFIHSPFPSSEIFRTLSVRNEILRGMLNADQIGFHAYGYARHFLTCCRRLLGLSNLNEKSGILGVEYQGRRVVVTVCHAGIEPEFVVSKLTVPRVLTSIKDLRSRIGTDRIVIVGVDVVERLKGIFLKLLAFEQLLREYPEWRSKVRLVQIGIRPSHFNKQKSDEDDIYEEPQKWRHDIAVISNRINNEFGNGEESLVHYEERDTLSLEDRVAVWATGNILLYTPVSDGLCLDPFEFLVVRDEIAKFQEQLKTKGKVATHLPQSKHTPLMEMLQTDQLARSQTGWETSRPILILSEFSAASRVLSGGLRVNPWRRDAVADCLVQALTMPLAERKYRNLKDVAFVKSHIMTEWAERVLTDLKRSRIHQAENEEATQEQLTYTGIGLGLGFRSIGFRPNFGHYDLEALSRAYRTTGAKQRILLLDLGGTLISEDDQSKTSFQSFHPKVHEPSESVLRSLQTLTADPNNTVFIISGKECPALESAFKGIENVGLAAEHGYFFSWGKNSQDKSIVSSGKRNWEMLDDHFDNSWMELSESIMNLYTQRTTGTYIESKGSTILWQYRDADPEFGVLQGKELRDHLGEVLNTFPVEVVAGKGYVEVRPLGCDKGKAAEHVINTITERCGKPEFVLAIGDDIADEKTFEYLSNYALKSNTRDSLTNSSCKLFTYVVGQKPSKAQHYVNDVEEVEQLLATLAKNSRQNNLSQSLGDIRLLDLFANLAEGHDGYGSESSLIEERGSFDSSTTGGESKEFTGGSSMHYSYSVPAFRTLQASHQVSNLSSAQKYLDNIAEGEDEGGINLFNKKD